MKQEPHHFSAEDFFKALFGSILVGMSFLFNKAMFEYAMQIQPAHIMLIIIITFTAVTLEIYALSYKFVKNRKERPFSEFWAKRFFTIIASSFVTIWAIVHIYNINEFITTQQEFKLIVAVVMPAAVAGAAIEILKKK